MLRSRISIYGITKRNLNYPPWIGGAPGHGGNGRLRTALYLASLSATRYNPAIKVFYERLRAAGKPMKVARCAAARKLVHVAWAVVTTGQPFEAGHAQQQGTRMDARALAA